MDIPQIIAGRFRIECEIGRGGMGTVYRASHLGLERRVAIKVLKQDIASDPEVAERFMREARTMARLRHPRAAMIFDAGRLADGRPFIVMEYVEGRTLAETLEQDGVFTPERAVRVASEICDVLAEAHALGIVHRDLKPSNIILNERGVCVLDFGIAKVLANATDSLTKTHPTTESGLVIGTPRYMSPEQCMGQKVGPASDLYSVGVLVYEMVAGRPPFTDQLASAVLVKQATTQPPALLALRPDAPRALAVATHTLLAKNPANRPKTAAEARQLLARSVAPAPTEAEEALRTQPFASTIYAVNTAGTSAVFRAATVFAAVVLLGAFLFAMSNRRQIARAESLDAEKAKQAATANPTDASASSPANTKKTSATAAAAAATRSTSRDSGVRDAPAIVRPAPADKFSPEEARRVAQAVARVPVSDARFVRTRRGRAVVAIHSKTKNGKAQIFVIERGTPGDESSPYKVASRGALDPAGFRAAPWKMEVVDLDRDGSEEALFTGETARGEALKNRRLVLYVPRVRETFTLHLTPDCCDRNTLRALWSANAMTKIAQPYRTAMRERAFANTRTF